MFFFFQAEDGIRDVLGSRGLGDVYKRQDYRGIWLSDGILFTTNVPESNETYSVFSPDMISYLDKRNSSLEQ